MVSTSVSKGVTTFALVSTMGLLLSGCASLPTNGPTAGQIAKTAKNSPDLRDIRMIDISSAVAAEPAPSEAAEGTGLAQLARVVPADRVGPGDVLSIQIFEVGAGLFTGGRAALGSSEGDAPPSASSDALGGGGIPVQADGSITLPYAGRLAAAGLTTDEIQDRIVAALKGKSQSPQVLVTIRQNLTNVAYMMGAVSKPGRLPLSVDHMRLLDGLAQAGGASAATTTGASTATGSGPQDFVVQLTRGSETINQRLDDIQPGSPDDLILAPGDHINVIRQPNTFTVLGASDHISQMPFESRVLSLAEALARIGGPSDSHANPRAIYVFRDVASLRPAIAVRAGTTTTDPAGNAIKASVAVPTIYRLDIMKADGLFLAQRFALRDKDLIYISNSSVNQPQKLVQLVGTLFSPFFAINAAVK